MAEVEAKAQEGGGPEVEAGRPGVVARGRAAVSGTVARAVAGAVAVPVAGAGNSEAGTWIAVALAGPLVLRR